MEELVRNRNEKLSTCSNFCRKFDTISMKVNQLDRGFQKTPIKYDPTKHIRATRLLVGVNTNNLPKVTRKDKYIYDDYKTRAKTNTIMNDDAFVNGTANNFSTGGNSNQFSYDNYLKKSIYQTTNLNPPKTNNVPPQSDNISSPFSYEAYKSKTQTLSKSQFSTYSKPPTANDDNPYSFNNNNVNDPFAKPINDHL